MNSDTLNPPQYEFLDLIKFAYLNGASDIHVESERSGMRVRVRKDGLLSEIKRIEPSRSLSFAENIKSLLGFDMAKFGEAQDSRYAHPEIEVDLRANLLGSLYGEKLCLRLLERGKEFSLDAYPLEDKSKRKLQRLIKKNQGLIIVSGPTGSGKSTLLYSILGSIDRHNKAVYTVEDPVEYSLDNLIQIPITKRVGFSEALKSLMRQDPDVIMVGEIRDAETAEAAVHAANTGHLVLTTVHANSAVEILTRLESLGVSKSIFESVVLFASAQRLPKKLCVNCRYEDQDAVPIVEDLFETKINFTPKASRGCRACGGLGIDGRILIFEHLAMAREAGKRILKPWGSLKQQAFSAVKAGLIDAGEAYSNFGD